MVKIIDVGQTMRTPGLYRVAKDYVIKERSMRILTVGRETTTGIGRRVGLTTARHSARRATIFCSPWRARAASSRGDEQV